MNKSLVATIALAVAVVAPAGRAQQPPARPLDAAIEILPVHGSVFMIAGAGGNITVSAGKDGVLLVDTGLATMSDKVLDAVRQLQRQIQAKEPPFDMRWGAETRGTLQNSLNPVAPPKPIRYIVNTHFHPDHVGGNERLAKAGRTFTGGNVAGDIADAGQGAAIFAYENTLNHLSAPTGTQAPTPEAAWPTDTFHQESMKLSHFFNGDGIQIVHTPAAHTDGDVFVYFRGSDVIATGDLFQMTAYPFIDVEHGGGINGIIDGVNRMLDFVIPEFRMEGGTMVVPGHGRLSDGADLAYYRDMLTIIRDRAQALIREGKTLEQVKAAKITADYDPRWGLSTERWSTDKFVEAVYKTLQPKPAAKPATAAPTIKKKHL
ncbi:MAG TPA: MBL fold metallo-hydrolase [Vicinamibacterales bacterium]|nr:MBL fold metallo-hydrolase [Vicinamibacterales bacterium]